MGETRRRDEPTGYFRAIAVDFDGTLAEDGRPDAGVLEALAEVRARGLRVVLATGRILVELRETFPDVDEHVDAVVGENGAVVTGPAGARLLALPVAEELAAALAARDVSCRRGEVLVACGGDDEHIVLDEVRRLGLDCQLLRNRSELMIVPAGVSKGIGLVEALGDLGLSAHNAIAVGDAENDHALLEVAELGVAVANAVESLKRHADVVLDLPNGAGVADLVRGPVVAGRDRWCPGRWRVTLGRDEAGKAVELPASQLNVLVTGGTGQGKSYVAGLVAEQLVGLGYTLVVVDPEGDHAGLGRLRGVLVTGGDSYLLPAAELTALIRQRNLSVVVDLSGLDADAQARYLREVPVEVEAQRRVSGVPQWLIFDEADQSVGRAGLSSAVFDQVEKGHCLVTWRPQELSANALAGIDAVVALTCPRPAGAVVDIAAAVADVSRPAMAALLTGGPGGAVLASRQQRGIPVAFRLGERTTTHLRHEHKYGYRGVAPERRFYFHTAVGAATGAVAANLGDLEAELDRCDRAVVRHHSSRGDFSRWIAHVLHHPALAARVASVEATVRSESPAATVDAARVRLVASLQARR
jgi:hydroxymethylpyrimidine pyrophosphatase-like HAD family hydrolase